jgi:hypothetical protein
MGILFLVIITPGWLFQRSQRFVLSTSSCETTSSEAFFIINTQIIVIPLDSTIVLNIFSR